MSLVGKPRDVGCSPGSHGNGRAGGGSTPEPDPRPAVHPAALALIYWGGDREGVGLWGVAQVAVCSPVSELKRLPAPKGKPQGRRDEASPAWAPATHLAGVCCGKFLFSAINPKTMWARPGLGGPGGPRRLFLGHWEPVPKEASPTLALGGGHSTRPSPQAGPFPAISQRAAKVCKGGAGAGRTQPLSPRKTPFRLPPPSSAKGRASTEARRPRSVAMLGLLMQTATCSSETRILSSFK